MIFNSACLFNNELPLDPIFLFLWNLSGCEQLQMPRSRSVSFQEKEKPKTELGFHGLPLVGRNAPGGSAAGTRKGLLWDPIILSSAFPASITGEHKPRCGSEQMAQGDGGSG